MLYADKIIQQYSAISFGLEKSAVVHMKRGKLVDSVEVQGIPILQYEESYTYLGIIETTLFCTTTRRKLQRKNSSKELETY